MCYEYLPEELQPSLFDHVEDFDDEYVRYLEYLAGALGISVEEAEILIVRDLPEAN